jgi:plasmid stabilization system protein ParE
MSYSVTWTPSAERDLTAVWLAAPDPAAVTLAAHQIERRLKVSPLDAGESRESSVSRALFVSPLAVAFDVVEDDKAVFIRFVQLVA